MERISIYKLIDEDDLVSDDQYYTLKGLRDYVINEMYEIWEEFNDERPFTKEQLKDDENLFKYLEEKGFYIETILEVTTDDFNL